MSKKPVESDKLTPEQIKNWRNILLLQIGPYALIMPDEEIQARKNIMQQRANEMHPPAIEPYLGDCCE